jgi:hypothetical protein
MDYCQAPELFFPIDGKHRKIYADASKVVQAGTNTRRDYSVQVHSYEGYYSITLYLVGYIV